MTPRERVVAAINHQEGDLAPWCIGFTGELEERLRARFDDAWFDAIANSIQPVQFPCWRFHEIPKSFKTDEEPGELPEARGIGRSFDEFHEEVDALGQGDRFVLVRWYASMWEKAWMARGMERLMADLAVNPAFAARLFDKILHMNLAVMDGLIENPNLDGVLWGSDWGGQQALLMSPDMWRRHLKPRYAQLFTRVREAGKYLFVHSCGCIEAIIPDIIEMGVQVLNPVQPECMDIVKLKREYGKDLCFWGGISTQQTLPLGTPSEVQREAADVLKVMGKDGGYILAPAQELQADVPDENVQALIDFAHTQKL